MTDKVNPSINRPAEAFKTAGAIAYGGHGGSGFIIPGTNPTSIAQQDSGINAANLEGFQLAQSGPSSLDVTIDAGEAFIFGSWVCIDVQTTVTLSSSTNGQTVFVGWNKSGSDDVVIGLPSAFSEASGDTDEKIPLFDFDTDGSGVTNSVDRRDFNQIKANSIEQGSGSGLNADSIDGFEATDLGSDVSDSGSTVVSNATDINFSSNISVSDDGDGSVSIDTSSRYTDSEARTAVDGSSVSLNHNNLTNISSGDHHSKTSSASELTDVSPDSTSNAHHSRYSDSEARSAVDGSSVSLNHDNLSGVSNSDHHSRYSDGEAFNSVEQNQILLRLDNRGNDPNVNNGTLWYRSDLD